MNSSGNHTKNDFPNNNSREAARLLSNTSDDAKYPDKKVEYIDEEVPGLDGEDVNLLHCESVIVPVKDFYTEVRALRDVQSYMENAVLLLNVHAASLQDIIEQMLDKVLGSVKRPKFTIETAKDAIFTSNSGAILSQTIQGTQVDDNSGDSQFDQSWICILCDLPSITERYVAIAKLYEPTNLSANCQEGRFVVLILTPTIEKMTKGPMETGRTFATLFMDLDFRQEMLDVRTERDMKYLLEDRMKYLITHHGLPENRKSTHNFVSVFDDPAESGSKVPIFQGLLGDLKRRLPHYLSDYKDGIFGKKTPHKVVATTLFLYFACVLPNVAFGMLNSNNTNGVIGQYRSN
ncbi:solute carrier family 4 member 11 isoform X2 [Patella vulgata]|uniref:solute carrier family 4 member 11 isoform X2 n=1 Tax=Patella vulgata TaxID=6465 RepID=UPI0024A8AFD0|nr:solute carrier family 4 member 11 isoform X2 [Patella vulgata]